MASDLLHIAVVSTLYPRPAIPQSGQFVHDQVKRIANVRSVTVVTGHAVFPPLRFLERWYGRSRPVPDPNDPGITVKSVPYIVIPRSRLRWITRLSHIVVVVRFVQAIHRRRCIDVIHAHALHPDGLSALIAGKLINVPVIVTVHGSDAFLTHGWFLDRLPNKFVLRKADRVIAVSGMLADGLRRRYGDDLGITVVENGIPLERFTVRPKAECASACGLNPDRPRVVCIGSIREVKGTDVLLAAWGRVVEAVGEAELLFVGSPAEVRHARWFEDLLDASGVRTSVKQIGPVSNARIQDFIGASDVLVSASRREGFGMTIVEALACGRPVVATRSGGPNGIVTPDLGILVPVEDPVSLADAIIKVLKCEARFDPQHLAGEARRRFDLNDRVKTILALYDDVLKRHKRLDTR